MNKKLISSLIAVAFLMKSVGVDCLYPAALTKEYALRPMASATAVSRPAEPVKGAKEAEPEEPTAKGEELSRPEKLNLILEEHPELDTAEKLLVYIKKDEPHLLDAISEEKQLEFLRDFIFLRYETIPLPKKVLKQLPGMTTDGARLDAIREARGIEKKELCKLAEIDSSVYAAMVKKKDFRRPENVYKVSKALKIDAIYIKKGKSWDEVVPDLEDRDKMFLCRFRKGWTQRDLIVKLEEAGLELGTDKMRSKEILVTKWEKQGKTPKPEKRGIIRKVLGESTLYKEADEIEAAGPEEAELVVEPSVEGAPKYLRGVPRTKIHKFFAEHPEVSGKTPSEIERDHGIAAVSTRSFLRSNKGAAEIYDVDFSEEAGRPSTAKELPPPPPVAEPKRPKITAEEAADVATEEKLAKKKAKKAEKAEPGRRPGRVIIEEPEADYAVYIGRDVCEWLRTPEDRDLVDGMDIEDAIYDLERICDKAEDMIEKEASPEIQKKIMRQWRWIEARDVLRRIKALVATELCDWDSPEIGQKAAEIIIGLVIDLDKVNKIKEWVEKNVNLVPEFEGCWNIKASETLAFLQGTYFNRANLIVAMLRSIGIPARYRIISFKKEMAEDTVSKGMVEPQERIVVEALITIEGHWNEITGDISRKCKWITLEPIEAEKIAESYRLNNIDEFAGKKASEQRRKAQGRTNPSGQLRALKAISSSA